MDLHVFHDFGWWEAIYAASDFNVENIVNSIVVEVVFYDNFCGDNTDVDFHVFLIGWVFHGHTNI